MTGTQLLSNSVKSLSAKQRIASFRQRFGEGHFYLACHAAMPASLTPDLLYSLWANFQRDTHGDTIEIPWIAVADFMLSSLFEEVGQELYEIDQEVQDELLNQLQQDSRLGVERIRELADFVMAYVEQQLDSPDLDVRDLAQGQQWRALAYKKPSEAAHSIATVLAQLPLSDKSEWIRMDALIGSLAEPLSAYQPLLNYIRAMASLARGNLDAAIAQMAKAVDANDQVRVEGSNLPIPDILHGRLPDLTEPDASPVPPRNKFILPIAIAGGTVVSLLGLIGIQNGLRSTNSQKPTSTGSVIPIPSQPSSSSTPTPQAKAQTSIASPSVASPKPQLQKTLPAIIQSPVTLQSQPLASSPRPTTTARANPNSQSSVASSDSLLVQLDQPPLSATQSLTSSQTPQLSPHSETTSQQSPLTVVVKKIKVFGNTVFGSKDLDPITRPLEGRASTDEDLKSVASAITELYVRNDYITSGAYLPPQRIENGVISIQVIEGALEKINIEGAQNDDADYIRRVIEQGISVPLNRNRLEAQLRLVQADRRFLKVDAVLSAGKQPGQSVLVVRVTKVDDSNKPIGRASGNGNR